MIDLEEALGRVEGIARRVGAFQKRRLGRAGLAVATKSSSIDLVTEVDRRSETMITEAIRAFYPQHAILAEESGMSEESSDYLWVVDPLDGTTNYAQGLPIFTVSIALQYRGETVLGVVYAPVTNQFFHALAGRGAFLNGAPIRVGAKQELIDCVLATGFPYDVHDNAANNLAYFNALILKARAIRRFGSAAYDLACVAAGKFDGYWELNLSPWDAAAGMLLVREAGGQVVPFRDDRKVSIIAANEAICRRIGEAIAAVDRSGSGQSM